MPNAMSIQSQYAFDDVVANEIPPLKPILIYAYPAQKLEKQSCQLKSCSLQV